MWRLAVALLLGQAASPVKLVSPTDQSKAATITTVGQKNTLDVNCVSGCSGGGGSGGSSSLVWVDGGRLTADEGLGPDGGVWAVYVVNPSAGGGGSSFVNAVIDGGWVSATIINAPTVHAVVQFDGGEVTAHVDNFPATQAISAAALPLPSGASTETTMAAVKAKTDNLDVALSTRTKPADQQHAIIDSSATIAVTGPLTDAQLRATPPSVYAVVQFDGGFIRDSNIDVALSTRTKPSDQQHAIIDSSATIAVTGPATDTQLRATPLPISGSVTATVASTTVTGSVAVTGPLTDTQLRNSAVPISVATLPALTTGAAVIGAVTQSGTWNVGLSAGAAVIGHVIADTGSTTAVTGNVTIVQATGTNLHAVLDATSTTTVTQATGTNLHTVVDSAPTTAVTNAGLTNLDVALSTRTKPADQQHTIIDSSATIATTLASTTITGSVAVTGPLTDTQLRAVAVPVSVATLPALTAGAAVIGSLTANQSVNVAQMNGVAVSMGNGAAGTGTQRVVLPGVAAGVSVPAALTPVMVGGDDDNGQAQFLKTTTGGQLYTVPLANQQYDQFQATLTSTGFGVITNIPSGTVGININVAGPVTGGLMVISVQDVASDDTSQVLGPITTGPVITAAGTYQFSATTRSNAIRVTHTIVGPASFGGTSISVVSHLGNDTDQIATIETANGATLAAQLSVQQRELYTIRTLLESMLTQMQLQTDIQSKLH